MSVVKIPCVLIATIGLYRCFTPPNVAAKAEQVSRESIPDRAVFAAIPFLKPFGVVTWAVGIAEVAIIIAGHFPSWLLSECVISSLLAQRNLQELQLTPVSMTGLLLLTSGTLLREYCFRTLSHLFTFELSIREGHRLITTGPYSVVRHPSYTGSATAFLGMLCWFGARGSWLRESGVLGTIGGKAVFGVLGTAMTVGVIAGLMRIPGEESILKRKFGGEWVEWASRVPYLLVPGVY
ncbi:hypothetical protein BDZ94DRAFT_1253011 [Collybia nuda]|uniref:Protein-S-isoprenylcysteine O-methyltransferase n=1 Tax=Collybia nuda TaxID=64659 RepID=A0A9P5Y8X5_9AGAR|nr:hypothetical protein BDZ94DRAFT_1253011 [Collybia nuda]